MYLADIRKPYKKSYLRRGGDAYLPEMQGFVRLHLPAVPLPGKINLLRVFLERLARSAEVPTT